MIFKNFVWVVFISMLEGEPEDFTNFSKNISFPRES